MKREFHFLTKSYLFLRTTSNDQWLRCVSIQGMNLHASQKTFFSFSSKKWVGGCVQTILSGKKGFTINISLFFVDPTLLHAKSTCRLIYARKERKRGSTEAKKWLSVCPMCTTEEATKGRKPKAHSIIWLSNVSIILSSVRIK